VSLRLMILNADDDFQPGPALAKGARLEWSVGA